MYEMTSFYFMSLRIHLLCGFVLLALPIRTDAQGIEIRKQCADLSKSGQKSNYGQLPRYSIEERDYDKSIKILSLRVVVPPEAINSGSMAHLACKLESDFQKEANVEALIFDDKEASRKLAIGLTDQSNYGNYVWHLKGHYVSKRADRAGFIEFVIPEIQESLLATKKVRVILSE
jgi:hypothetical protein